MSIVYFWVTAGQHNGEKKDTTDNHFTRNRFSFAINLFEFLSTRVTLKPGQGEYALFFVFWICQNRPSHLPRPILIRHCTMNTLRLIDRQAYLYAHATAPTRPCRFFYCVSRFLKRVKPGRRYPAGDSLIRYCNIIFGPVKRFRANGQCRSLESHYTGTARSRG